jgi:hypothetical protein
LTVRLDFGDALDFYGLWPTPTLIVSDGAYGIGGFAGDPVGPRDLPAWYALHIAAWSAAATGRTTLWFWNTEIGWACVHPVLAAAGWAYQGAQVWDKGPERLALLNRLPAGRFPPISELVVQYTRAGVPAGEPVWHQAPGLTNIWREPSNRGEERILAADGSLAHPNQKPLALMERLIAASSNPGDVLWEPFGGLCSASLAGSRMGRRAFAAECRPTVYEAARERLRTEAER